MEAPPIIQPVSELKKKSKEEEKNTELEKKIDKFILQYKETINKQLKIQSKYGSKISIINNKQHFKNELDEEENKYYININNKWYTLKETIIFYYRII